MKAIKISKMLESNRNLASLINEIDSMRGLSHPNICKMHGLYEDTEHIYIVLDYCKAEDMFQRILYKDKISEHDAQIFTKKCLQMLTYLHQVAKVVHRDLKPENILLLSQDNDYDFKLADFGLSTRFDCEDLLEVRCGSPGYVAPEILKDQPYGPKSDMFSLGVTLYIMLSGRAPFKGDTVKNLLISNINCKVVFPTKYFQGVSYYAFDFIT